jgi:hypothetical protein
MSIKIRGVLVVTRELGTRHGNVLQFDLVSIQLKVLQNGINQSGLSKMKFGTMFSLLLLDVDSEKILQLALHSQIETNRFHLADEAVNLCFIRTENDGIVCAENEVHYAANTNSTSLVK